MDETITTIYGDLNKQLGTCLVIGGGLGFLGPKIVQVLVKYGCDVHILSHFPVPIVTSKIKFFHGDVQNLNEVLEACKGVNTVFHVASIIVSGNLLNKKRLKHLYNVNVQGTENVIKACKQCGVERLVYTSSDVVVFNGTIINGDESLPYTTKIWDQYTKTKLIAEQAILKANGPDLMTCALRPSAIYGVGDKLILHRVAEIFEKGHFWFRFGSNDVLQSMVYVDNLVDAHILAATKLTKESSIAAGQAYFINDGEPINYFEFSRRISQEFGYDFPSRSIPFWIVYPISFIAECFHWLFGTRRPQLSRMDVRKIYYSNYYSIEKARRELGYNPKVLQDEGIKKLLPYFYHLFDRIRSSRRTKG